MKLRLLSQDDVRQALPMTAAIEGMKSAYSQLSGGKAEMPLRSHLPTAVGSTLVMPAYLPQDNSMAVKVVSVFPENSALGLPLIHALVLAVDAQTGQPVALLEGGSLTAIRTGAASGAATDILANPDAAIVAIFGCGRQARTQLEAVCTVRKIEEVRVFCLDQAGIETFAAEMAGQGPIPTNIQVAASATTAVADADIICTATTSNTPVFDGMRLKPGAHVNGVGSFLPSMQEIDLVTVQRALVVVDSREAVWEEAGDLIIPLQNGDISADHIHAELGEIINGAVNGRTTPNQITFFKSVGVAVQDAAAAGIALQYAQEHNLGKLVNL